MRNRSSKAEFIALFTFLLGATLVVTNGFAGRIFAQDQEYQIYEQVEPIGDVIAEIMQSYVYQPDVDRAVEGALQGIMSSLDQNSSYIPAESLQSMREDTEGAFDGIGVQIRYDEEAVAVLISQPIPGAPAMNAGIRSGDLIIGVDGVSVADIAAEAADSGDALERVSSRIKGPRGTQVSLSISRAIGETDEREILEIEVTRGKIPLESIVEAQLLDNDIGYVRISDFKKNTSTDLRREIEDLRELGMRAVILDLRWNPGGLLNAARDVSELFLKKGSLVTSTRGRADGTGAYTENMSLRTDKRPALPEDFPVIVLVNEHSASSSEIVTGALQFHQRALIVGQTTFGKGSVQTIIPLRRPEGSALRLTTALYYTPADVTIDQVGIVPDVEVIMTEEEQRSLLLQLRRSMEDNPMDTQTQDHGSATGNDTADAVQDPVLQRAVEILMEDPIFENLIERYHRPISETQRMASKELRSQKVH